jgi:hypothetical protein
MKNLNPLDAILTKNTGGTELQRDSRPETPHGTKQLVPYGATWLPMILEVEPQLGRVRPWRNEVRSTEGG